MSTWTNDELKKIGAGEELEIASLRQDGTLTKPVTIWVVRDGDDIYVRSVNGRSAAWFRGTHVRREGRIETGGLDRDVMLKDAEFLAEAKKRQWEIAPISGDRLEALAKEVINQPPDIIERMKKVMGES